MTKAERPISQRVKSCVIVLGSDGSASAAMSGVLGSLGCELPKSAGAMSQCSRICDFNDELLASAGSSRDDFTSFYEEWLQSPRAPEFLDRAASLLDEEFGSVELFLLSDPSISRLLPFWMEALKRFGCTPDAVIVIRNPAAPSGSSHRNEALSQIVWLRNMLDAEKGTRGTRRACASFEDLLNGWEAVTDKMRAAFQLVWPRPAASVEFDVASMLNRLDADRGTIGAPSSGALLPAWLQEAYEILSRWAAKGEDETDYKKLDRIRSEFDVAASAFARVIRGANALEAGSATRSVRAFGAQGGLEGSDGAGLKAMLQDQRRKTTLLNADLHKQIEARETLEAQLIEAQAELEASRARRKEMARVIANRDAKIDRLYGELGALQRHLVRSSPLWQVKAAFRWLGRSVRRPAPQPVPEAPSLN